jgi:hypothetical protein
VLLNETEVMGTSLRLQVALQYIFSVQRVLHASDFAAEAGGNG